MKNTNYFFITLLLFLVACQSKTSENNKKEKAQEKLLCSSDSRASDASHLIPFSDAKRFIYAFANEVVNKPKTILWTEIPIERLNLNKNKELYTFSDNHCGLLSYFCFNEPHSYHLASTTTTTLNDENEVPYPEIEDNSFFSSVNSGIFSKDDMNENDIAETLTSTISHGNDASDDYTKDDVRELVQGFINELHSQSSGTENYPLGFFHRDQLKEIIEGVEKCKGLRIYWGFEKVNNENIIKLVAFAMDSTSQNITTDRKILERSWPPYGS